MRSLDRKMKYSIGSIVLSFFVGYVGNEVAGLVSLFVTIPISAALGVIGAYLDNK
jgi:hypothetical protein